MHIRGHLYLSTNWLCMDNLGTRIPMFNNRIHLHLIQTLISKIFPNLSPWKLNFFPSVIVVLKLPKTLSKSTKFTLSTPLSCQISIKRHFLKRGEFLQMKKEINTVMQILRNSSFRIDHSADCTQNGILYSQHYDGYTDTICNWSEQEPKRRARTCFSYWHIPSYPPVPRVRNSSVHFLTNI